MADIGQTLREARMRARIDMTEVELRTKIRARYLRAIENEEWDLLPGPVYIKSFLRTYADFLGLDSRLLVDEFKRQYERPSDHEMRPAPTLRQSRERRERRERDRSLLPPRGPLVPPWMVIVVVLVAVVVALYLIGSGGTNRPNPTSSVGTTHKHHRHQNTFKPVKHHKHKAKPKAATVKLVPTGSVYICAENRSGHILVPGTTYSAGQTIPTLRGGQIFLTLGNNAVSMTANGKKYPVAASAAAIGLKVTTKGVRTLAPGHSPTCTTTGTTAGSTSGAAG